MNPLRSVGARLSLALLLVIAGALTTVYLLVIPSLEGRLIDNKISQLKVALRSLQVPARRHQEDQVPFWYQDQATALNARIVLFAILSETPRTLRAVQDSNGGESSFSIEPDPLALNASVIPGSFARGTNAFQHGTVSRDGTRYAEVAASYAAGSVLLVSAPLADALDAVDVAKERMLLAGGIVLGAVLVIGYLGARLFARRIRRLEHAAGEIASGRFDDPIVDQGRDELGNLARAFDRMRLRLAQLDSARREFIANASHELRTPLFALGGFLELMDEDLDPATREEFLASMRDQVRRLTKLATELLDLSRLDAGQIEIEHEPVSLGASARLVADEFAAVATQTQHPLAVDVDEEALALADEQRVVQIIRILVENAFVHTPPNTSVLLRVRRGPGAATLTVEDSGPGMPPGQAEHVFERFYRGEGGPAFGSGLGLAIARELAQAMGGTLELEVAPGRTAFRLTLPPASLGDVDASAPREPVASA